jgi:hypothetical protein
VCLCCQGCFLVEEGNLFLLACAPANAVQHMLCTCFRIDYMGLLAIGMEAGHCVLALLVTGEEGTGTCNASLLGVCWSLRAACPGSLPEQAAAAVVAVTPAGEGGSEQCRKEALCMVAAAVFMAGRQLWQDRKVMGNRRAAAGSWLGCRGFVCTASTEGPRMLYIQHICQSSRVCSAVRGTTRGAC